MTAHEIVRASIPHLLTACRRFLDETAHVSTDYLHEPYGRALDVLELAVEAGITTGLTLNQEHQIATLRRELDQLHHTLVSKLQF
ncbi:MAG: hypothetical protein HY236_07140 [Acidobacteria bacterium]|nr:hypothetical protein [Acidobacteriota bacterium]